MSCIPFQVAWQNEVLRLDSKLLLSSRFTKTMKENKPTNLIFNSEKKRKKAPWTKQCLSTWTFAMTVNLETTRHPAYNIKYCKC